MNHAEIIEQLEFAKVPTRAVPDVLRIVAECLHPEHDRDAILLLNDRATRLSAQTAAAVPEVSSVSGVPCTCWYQWTNPECKAHGTMATAQASPTTAGADEGGSLMARLMTFYQVGTVAELVAAQDQHIKRLQEKSPVREPVFPAIPRHG